LRREDTCPNQSESGVCFYHTPQKVERPSRANVPPEGNGDDDVDAHEYHAFEPLSEETLKSVSRVFKGGMIEETPKIYVGTIVLKCGLNDHDGEEEND
jgi:hypothetical protein